MAIKKQAFKAHLETIGEHEYRVIYYSDTSSANLYQHSHDFYEMFLLVSGKIMYLTGGNSFHLRPGDILFINRHQMHTPALVDPTVPYERIALHVSPTILQALSTPEISLHECFVRDNYVVYHFPKETQIHIKQLLAKLFNLNEKRPFGHELLARAYLTELFVEINQYNHDKSIYVLSENMKETQFLALARQYISDHLGEDLSIDDVAGYVCMSKYYFMHTFKQLTGMSAYQFILQERLKAACSLVRKGLSLTTISQQCGFGDYSNFYRAFRRQYGISPKDYSVSATSDAAFQEDEPGQTGHPGTGAPPSPSTNA